MTLQIISVSRNEVHKNQNCLTLFSFIFREVLLKFVNEAFNE